MTNLNWKSVSGYIIGRSHVSYDEPCQDRALHFKNGDLDGIVVSDGAGSCKYSEQGAIAVTNAIATISSNQFTEWYEAENTAELMEAYLAEVLHELQQQEEGSALLDFSSTLLAVVVKGNQYLAAHVGDGVICQRINQDISVLSHPENGRYANETYFVTMTPLRHHFRIYKGEMTKPHDFMVMSDGAAISFYLNSKREMELTNTTTLFEHLAENTAEDVQAEFPDFLKLLQKNTQDDCAVAILVSHGAASNEVNDEAQQLSSCTVSKEDATGPQVVDENKQMIDPFDDNYEDQNLFDDDDYEDEAGLESYVEDTNEAEDDRLEKVLPRPVQAYEKTSSPQSKEADSSLQETGEKTSHQKTESQAYEEEKRSYVRLNQKVKATPLFKLLPKR